MGKLTHGRPTTSAVLIAWALLACALSSGLARPLTGAEAPGDRLAELLPKTTVAAILAPNLAATRAAAGKTLLADMLSQPEMQAFLRPPLDYIQAAYAELQKKRMLFPAPADLEQVLLNGSLVAAVYERAEGPQPKPGVLVCVAPKDPAALARVLSPLIGAQMPPEGQPVPLGLEQDAPAYVWAQGRLIFCAPQVDLPAVLKRLNAPAGDPESLAQQADFKALRRQFASPAVLAYMDLQKYLDFVLALAGAPQREVQTARSLMQKIGMENLTGFGYALSIAGEEWVVEAFAGLKDPKARTPGDWALGQGKPISPASLKIAAPDAPYVQAGYFDCAALVQGFRTIIAGLNPRDAAEMDEVLSRINRELGFNLETDLLANIGGELVIAETPLETGLSLLPLPGLVASVPAKNAATVDDCLKKLQAWLARFPPAQKYGVEMRQTTHAGRQLYHLHVPFTSLPLVACLTGDRLLIGTSINAVRRGLEQLAAPGDILANPDFQKTIARLSGRPFDPQNLPPAFAYAVDEGSGGGLFLCTGLGLLGSCAAVGALAQFHPPADADAAGAEPPADPFAKVMLEVLPKIDPGMWPDEGFFRKYRRSRGAAATWLPQGVFSRCELPPPFPGRYKIGSGLELVAVAGIAAGVALPAVGRGREQARRVSSANNLHQLAAACVLYADAAQNAGQYPRDPLDLCGAYVRDWRVFRNLRYPEQDEGYVYVVGPRPEDVDSIIFYENVPIHAEAQGRNVALAAGSVEWMEQEDFQRRLAETQKRLQAANRPFKLVPVSCQAVRAKLEGRPVAPVQPPPPPPRGGADEF